MTAPLTPLIEREAELTVIEDAVARSEGAGVLISVEGDVGVGKTALLDGACELARAAGMATSLVRGAELERDLSLGVVRRLLGPILDRARAAALDGPATLAAPLFERPCEVPADDAAAPGLLPALHAVTQNLASRAPLLLGIDDAHWADEASLRWLVFLSARLDDLPVTIIVASRPAEPGAPAGLLAALARGAGRRHLPLGPLSAAAVERVVRQVRPECELEFRRACAEVCAGNPWMLTELLHALELDNAPSTAGSAERVRLTVPETVRRTAVAHLARWCDGSLALVEAIAVLGDSAHLRHAATLAGLTLDQASATAAVHSRTGFLREGEPLAFAQPMVREAVYAELGAARRALLHGRAARLLDREGASSNVAVARQLLTARCDADPWAVAVLRAAARSALEQGAPATAAGYLRRALAEPPPPSVRAEVIAELGRVELAGGAPGGAARLAGAIALFEDARERAELLRELGGHLYAAGQPADALAAFDRGLAEIDGTDPALRASLETRWLVAARLLPSRCREAGERIAPTLASPPPGRTYSERVRLASAAGHLVFAGEPRERALDLVTRAMASGALLRDETTDGVGWMIAVAVLVWSGATNECDQLTRAVMDAAGRRPSVPSMAAGHCAAGFHAFVTGHLQDARTNAEHAIELAASGWVAGLPAARLLLAWVLVEADEPAGAEALLASAWEDPIWGRTALGGLALEARARVRLAQGKSTLALDDAMAAGAALEAARVHNPSVCPWRSCAAVAAAHHGEHTRASTLADDELELARRFGAPRAIGIALRASGLIRDGDDAIERLQESAALLERSPAELEHARSLVELGAALRRRRRRAESRVPLRGGLKIAARLGAAALERRARDELAASGARPRRRDVSGVNSLTPSERRVVEMAAAGMTNREISQALFVTVKAVQWHLHHAYLKLDVQSRDGFAEALAEPDGAEPAC